jgi:hypothetical protein
MRYSYRQCVITKFAPATDTKPARIIATASGGSRVTHCYDFDGDVQEHKKALRKLIDKLGWTYSDFVGASLPGDKGIVWVNTYQNNLD